MIIGTDHAQIALFLVVREETIVHNSNINDIFIRDSGGIDSL